MTSSLKWPAAVLAALLMGLMLPSTGVARLRHRHRPKHHPRKKAAHAVTPVTIPLISFPEIPQRFVEVNVNGGSSRLFMLDTGSADTALFEWYAEEFKLHSEELENLDKTVGISPDSTPEPKDFYRVTLASLKAGPVERTALPAIVLKDQGVFKRLNVAGVLSPQTFLVGRTFTIDFKQNLIVLDSKLKKQLRVETPLVDCGNQKRFALEASINGTKGKFEISSGYSRATINHEFALRSSPARGPEPILIGGKKIKEEILKIEQHEHQCEAIGALGMNFLEGVRLTFSKDRKTLIVEK